LKNYLEELDQTWFLLINNTLTHTYLDRFFGHITNLHHHSYFLYVVVPACVLFYVWRSRVRAIKVIALVGLVIGLSDTFSYRVLKPVVSRARPKNTLGSQVQVRVPYYPKSDSFPSNHALSGFAVARLLVWLYPLASPWFYGTAAVIAYSRVYVGVHYPGDVIGGGLIGYVLSSVLIWILFSRFKFFSSAGTVSAPLKRGWRSRGA
jgi:undecaprenyl-diphosphatase